MNPDSEQTANETSENPDTWHVVKRTEGHCDILNQEELGHLEDEPQTWGPFASKPEAIAKRVGLIRAGKCQPK